eukprot:3272798-Prymnesium_polylepis.1
MQHTHMHCTALMYDRAYPTVPVGGGVRSIAGALPAGGYCNVMTRSRLSNSRDQTLPWYSCT